MRQQLVRQLDALGLTEPEIRTVLALPFNGMKPCYVVENMHEA
jgi:hypothetical protein